MPEAFKANGQIKVKYVGHVAPHIYLTLKRVAAEQQLTLGGLLEKMTNEYPLTSEIAEYYAKQASVQVRPD